MKFTDDPYVKDTLTFLMTREIAHYKMFQGALESIQPNFPPGVLQDDPRFTQQYFNLSPEKSAKGPWNEGKMPGMDKEWEYIDDPVSHVKQTNGLTNDDTGEKGNEMAAKEKLNKELSEIKSREVKESEPDGTAQWSDYE